VCKSPDSRATARLVWSWTFNAALVADVSLQVGEVKEVIQVQSEALHVETASSQLGEVIEGERITTVPW